ncbi:MAG: hypothetical protein SVV03_02165 [Candidatus Nanohaloarchaea archaeon]|nr:hypothetical protein [Candidatus Nanohaloarchaea archaeon]
MVEYSFQQVMGIIASAVVAVAFIGIVIQEGGSIVGSSDKVSNLLSAVRTSQALELASTSPRTTASITLEEPISSLHIKSNRVEIQFEGELIKVSTRLSNSFESQELDSTLQDTSEICITNDGKIEVGEQCNFDRCISETCMQEKGYAWICRSGVLDSIRRCPS